MLADKRIAKVPGRIMLLIVSIQTMKGIKIAGVPIGTKWVNICWVLLIHPKSIKHNHNGKDKDKVNVKWLVLVKIYGNNPMKLLNIIIENTVIKINVDPLDPIGSRRILISLWRVIIILFQKIWYREGSNQYIEGIIKIPRIVLIQFNDKLKILDVGSNTENKFVIIFR